MVMKSDVKILEEKFEKLLGIMEDYIAQNERRVQSGGFDLVPTDWKGRLNELRNKK